MIPERLAKDQVMRFACLDFFPTEEKAAALKELIAAMMAAATAIDARTVADDIMASSTACPKPAEIRAALRSKSVAQVWEPDPQEENAPKRCPRCDGTGWIHERRLVHLPCYGPQGQWNDYAGRCPSCNRASAARK